MGVTMRLAFVDKLALEFGESGVKSGLSMRDGVVLYSGAELGLEPADKMFTVYRSPATVANAAMALKGVPLIDGHIDPDDPVTDPKGVIVGTEMVGLLDPQTASTLAVRNDIQINPEFLPVVSDPAGPRELSLGYKADLVPHDEWDFEQIGFDPRHLAAVPAGRCGPVCSFVDHNTREVKTMSDKRKGAKPKLHKAFADENGDVNITEVVEIANQLPEALKEMPLEKLRELIPILQEAVKGADTTLVESGEESMLDEGTPETDPEKKAADERKFEDAVSKHASKFVDAAVQAHVDVIEKARGFLPDDYAFAGKKTNQIMRDALATQADGKFTDAELSMALKYSSMGPACFDDSMLFMFLTLIVGTLFFSSAITLARSTIPSLSICP